MALRVVTVKSAGGDYSSLNAAFAGESGDLVALDRQLEIDCYNFADSTAANTGGAWTTDATRSILTRAVDNHGGRFGGIDGISAYRLTGRLDVLADNVEYRGLSMSGGFNAPGNNVSAVRCVGLGDGSFVYVFQWSGATGRAESCHAIGTGSSPTVFGFAALFATVSWYDCLSANTQAAFYSQFGGLVTAKNCLAAAWQAGNGFVADGAWDAASRNCASSDSTSPNVGSGHRINQTFTFVNAAGGDYHLAESDTGARRHGVDLSADATYPITVDIDGESIPSYWNIGADQNSIPASSWTLNDVAPIPVAETFAAAASASTTLPDIAPLSVEQTFSAAAAASQFRQDVAPLSILVLSGAQTYAYVASGGLTSGGSASVARRAVVVATGGLTASGAGTIRARAAIVPSGGLTSGGTASSSLRKRFAPSGGLVAAGAAVIIASAHLVASGGLASSGAAAITTRASIVASGGLTSAGAATTAVTHRYTYLPDGGLSSGGAATIAARMAPAPSGGLTASGIATIATRARVVGSGGLATGGTATIAARAIVAPSGGLTSSGAATVDRRYRFAPSGGLDSGGEAGVVFAPASGGTTFTYSASGGLTSGGTATNALVRAFQPSGGLDSGGSATTRRRRAFVASGGLTASGSAAIVRTAVVHGAGGLTASGSAPIVAARSVIATGGLTSSGTGTSRYRHAFTPSGGLASGGTATVAFVRRFAFVATGGLTASGAATIIRGAVIVPTGGLVSGGAAKTQFFREDKFLVAIPRSRVYIAAQAESRVTVEFAPVLTAESHSRPFIEAVASSQAVQQFDETIVSAAPRSHPLIAATALSRVLTFILT